MKSPMVIVPTHIRLNLQTSAGSVSRRAVRCCAAQSFCDPEVRFLVTLRTRHRKMCSASSRDLFCMLQLPGTGLWLGNLSDLRDIPQMLAHGITAIIDLAIEEPIPRMPRTTNYCRFVMTDDGENDPANIRAAILTTASFLSGGHMTAVCCNAGLSRSPCIAAASVSCHTGRTPAVCLESIAVLKTLDVNPALWNQVLRVLAEITESCVWRNDECR